MSGPSVLGDRFIANRSGAPVSTRYELAATAEVQSSQRRAPVGSPLSSVWDAASHNALPAVIPSREQRVMQERHRQLMRQQLLSSVGGNDGGGQAVTSTRVGYNNGRFSGLAPLNQRSSTGGQDTSRGPTSIVNVRMTDNNNTTLSFAGSSPSASEAVSGYSSFTWSARKPSRTQQGDISGMKSTPRRSRPRHLHRSLQKATSMSLVSEDSLPTQELRQHSAQHMLDSSVIQHDLSLSAAFSSPAPGHLRSRRSPDMTPAEVAAGAGAGAAADVADMAQHLSFSFYSPIAYNAASAGPTPVQESNVSLTPMTSPAALHYSATTPSPSPNLKRPTQRPITSTPLSSRMSSLMMDDLPFPAMRVPEEDLPSPRFSYPGSAGYGKQLLRRDRAAHRRRVPLNMPVVDLNLAGYSPGRRVVDPITRLRQRRLAHRALDFPGSTMSLVSESDRHVSAAQQPSNVQFAFRLSENQQQQQQPQQPRQALQPLGQQFRVMSQQPRRPRPPAQPHQAHSSFTLYSTVR